MSTNDVNFCVVIPAYREQGRIGEVVKAVQAYARTVVVVDDGSDDDTGVEALQAGATVLTHPENRGKGASLNTGFDHAVQAGYEFVITMDADGQHAPEDIPGFVAEYRRGEFPVLVGNRMDKTEAMPLVRRLTNRFMSWLLSRKIGQRVPDTQSGFRLYRCDVIPLGLGDTERFAAESEILLELGRRGVRIGAVPMQVIYGDEKSKIRPVRDTIRFFRMLKKFESRTADRQGTESPGPQEE